MTNLNAFQSFKSALIARHFAEMELRKDVETADTKALLNVTRKYDENALNAGFTKVAHWAGVSVETLAQRFTITDKKSAHFVNLKGIQKFAGLVAFLGGESVKLDNQLGNFLKIALTALVTGEYAIFKNAVVGAELSQQKCRYALGYKAGETSEDMDFLIDLNRADYGISTITTQTSQIKTLLIAVGLASGIRGKSSGVRLSGEFVRALNGLKDKIHYNAESKGYYGKYAL